MSGKRTNYFKPTSQKRIAGDHILRFHYDQKSGHPFMSISKKGDYYYGHEMTSSPSLKESGEIRSKYIRFRKNPNGNQPKSQRSYYRKRIKMNLYSPVGGRLKLKKKWKIGKSDLKRLKRIDKYKIKNVRTAKY